MLISTLRSAGRYQYRALQYTAYSIIVMVFFSFKKHVTNHHPKEILSLDDFFKMRREVVAKAPTPDGEEEVPEDGPPPVIGPAPEELPPGMEREGTVSTS